MLTVALSGSAARAADESSTAPATDSASSFDTGIAASSTTATCATCGGSQSAPAPSTTSAPSSAQPIVVAIDPSTITQSPTSGSPVIPGQPSSSNRESSGGHDAPEDGIPPSANLGSIQGNSGCFIANTGGYEGQYVVYASPDTAPGMPTPQGFPSSWLNGAVHAEYIDTLGFGHCGSPGGPDPCHPGPITTPIAIAAERFFRIPYQGPFPSHYYYLRVITDGDVAVYFPNIWGQLPFVYSSDITPQWEQRVVYAPSVTPNFDKGMEPDGQSYHPANYMRVYYRQRGSTTAPAGGATILRVQFLDPDIACGPYTSPSCESFWYDFPPAAPGPHPYLYASNHTGQGDFVLPLPQDQVVMEPQTAGFSTSMSMDPAAINTFEWQQSAPNAPNFVACDQRCMAQQLQWLAFGPTNVGIDNGRRFRELGQSESQSRLWGQVPQFQYDVCRIGEDAAFGTLYVTTNPNNPPPDIAWVAPAPGPITVQQGNSTKLATTTTGGAPPYTHSWSFSKDGQTWGLPPRGSPDAPTYEITNAQDADAGYYVCHVQDQSGRSDDALPPAQVIVQASPDNLTVSPAQVSPSTAVDGVDDVTLSCSVSGTRNICNQWEFQPQGSAAYQPFRNSLCPGTAAGAFIEVISPARMGDAGQYRCVGWYDGSPGSYTYGDPGTLTVVSPPSDPRVQGAFPVAQEIPEGSYAEMWVDVSGTPPMAFQWQRDVGQGWENLPPSTDPNPGRFIGATSSALLRIGDTVTTDTGSYRCVVTGLSVVPSQPATLTVTRGENTGPARIITQPQDSIVPMYKKNTFAVVAAGQPPLAYDWQYNCTGERNCSGSDPWKSAGCATAQCELGQKKYRVRVSNNDGQPHVVTSNEVRGQWDPMVDEWPQPQDVVEGSSATFSVTAQGTNLRYQWQSRRNGSPIRNEGGPASVPIYVTPPLTIPNDNGREYRVLVTSDYGTVEEPKIGAPPWVRVSVHSRYYVPTYDSPCKNR